MPEVTQLLLDEGPDLADLTFLTEQIVVKDVPDWDEDVLLLLERGQRRPGVGVAGGDGRRGVRDIFCHRTAENRVFFDSIESVRPAVKFFSPMGSGLASCIFWLSTVFGSLYVGQFLFLQFLCTCDVDYYGVVSPDPSFVECRRLTVGQVGKGGGTYLRA